MATTACAASDGNGLVNDEETATAQSSLSLAFQPFATHPSIAAQPESGRRVSDIAVQGNNLIVGYGDYNANTGPIDVAALDATTGAASVLLAATPTEAILTYRTIDGVLYGPETDPRTPWLAPAGYATSSGGWHSVRNSPAQHLYDITKVGNKLVLVGSYSDPVTGAEGGAVAYVSSDDGATWQVGQTDASTPAAVGYERYYWAVNLNGKIYMQAESVTPAAPVRIFDGTRWSKGTTDRICAAYEGHYVEAFNGLIYCGSRVSDGSRWTQTSLYVVDWFKYGGFLYGVDQNGKVIRTNGIRGKGRNSLQVTWEAVGQGPTTSRSIAIVNGRIYLGQIDGSVWVSSSSL
jgi:hypothetical protein